MTVALTRPRTTPVKMMREGLLTLWDSLEWWLTREWDTQIGAPVDCVQSTPFRMQLNTVAVKSIHQYPQHLHLQVWTADAVKNLIKLRIDYRGIIPYAVRPVSWVCSDNAVWAIKCDNLLQFQEIFRVIAVILASNAFKISWKKIDTVKYN